MIPIVYYDETGVITQSAMVDAASITDTSCRVLEVDSFSMTHDHTHYVSEGVLCEYSPDELAAKASMSAGWVWKMPERVAVDIRSLVASQGQAWARIKSARDTALSLPFTCGNLSYDSNHISIPRAVQLAAISKAANQPYSEVWTLADNTHTTLDADGMIGVGVALGKSVSGIREKARQLRTLILSTTDNTTTDGIVWTL